jgi:hypothetical protein
MTYELIENIEIGPMHASYKRGGSRMDQSVPLVLNPQEFIDIANGASCADLRNRLFVIDQKHVFWDKASNQADASFSQVLFGNNPHIILCSRADSVNGPRTFYNDEEYRTLFQTISENVDRQDLGLGRWHHIQQLTVKQSVG